MFRSSRPQFFLSILTAMMTGVGIAYITIIGVKLVAKPEVVARTFSTLRAAAEGMSLDHLLSKQFIYEAEAMEEDLGDDIIFTNESLSARVDSSGAAISALAYSVQSLDKENVLVERNSEQLLPIASITKLITAVVAQKFFDDDDVIEITSSVLATEGTTGKFRLGEKYKVREILYPLLIVSSNDAAEALAQAYDKKHGRGKFVKAMNDWVSEIGAYRTYFRDASGLSPQNVSSAHDLSLIAKWIKDTMPEIFDITLTKAKTIRSHTWINPTHFLSLSSYTGGKNGYTTEARLTNISLFALGNPQRLYSVVLLGSQSRDRDTISVLNEAVK